MFREALEECYGKLTELGLLIQEILNECMGLPPGFLKGYNSDRSFDFISALRYFPATEEENNGLIEHQDGNCITFVLQDGVGGLEVLKDGGWVPAEPVEGSIVVNIGDVMQVHSYRTDTITSSRQSRLCQEHIIYSIGVQCTAYL